MAENVLLEMRGITKTFPGVKALDNVCLEVQAGHIHALVGENGAGKSTLMNVLSGIYRYGSYTGDIYFDGELCKFKGIEESERKGIVIIHQELALVPQLSVAENLFLGNERLSCRGVVDWGRTNMEAKKLLQTVGLHIEPQVQVQTLGVGKQQLIEIAKALSKNVRLLILDEPFVGLDPKASFTLKQLMRELCERGHTIFFSTHVLEVAQKLCDRIAILMKGRIVAQGTMEEVIGQQSLEQVFLELADHE